MNDLSSYKFDNLGVPKFRNAVVKMQGGYLNATVKMKGGKLVNFRNAYAEDAPSDMSQTPDLAGTAQYKNDIDLYGNAGAQAEYYSGAYYLQYLLETVAMPIDEALKEANEKALNVSGELNPAAVRMQQDIDAIKTVADGAPVYTFPRYVLGGAVSPNGCKYEWWDTVNKVYTSRNADGSVAGTYNHLTGVQTGSCLTTSLPPAIAPDPDTTLFDPNSGGGGCSTIQLPGKWVINPVTGACENIADNYVPPTKTCPSGSSLINGACVVDIFDPTPNCPTGSSYINGKCVSIIAPPPTGCPSGSTMVNGNCVPNAPVIIGGGDVVTSGFKFPAWALYAGIAAVALYLITRKKSK